MKNTRSDNQNDDNQANRDDASNESSGGLFGGLLGAVEGTQDMAEATRDAQNRGVGGAADSAVGGITGMAEAAKQQSDRQTADNMGIFGDLANSVSDASRDFGAGASGGTYGGGSSGGGGDTGRRWDETPEVGVTYDAQGNRVDAGSSGGGGGGLIDSLVGGATGVAEGAEQAVETRQQDDGEWTSLSGTDDAVGSESFDERLRRAHEEAGTGWYGGSQTSADDNNNNSGT